MHGTFYITLWIALLPLLVRVDIFRISQDFLFVCLLLPHVVKIVEKFPYALERQRFLKFVDDE